MANVTSSTGNEQGNKGKTEVSQRVKYLGYLYASALHPAGKPGRPLVHQIIDGKVAGKSAMDFVDFLNLGERDGLCSNVLCRGEGNVEMPAGAGIIVVLGTEGKFFPLGANCVAALNHIRRSGKVVTLDDLKRRDKEVAQAAVQGEANAARAQQAAKYVQRIEVAKQKGLERLFAGDCREMLVNASTPCAASGSSHTCEQEMRFAAILFKGKWTIKAICTKANRARAASKSQIKAFETEEQATKFVAEREAAFHAQRAAKSAAPAVQATVEAPKVETKPAPAAPKSEPKGKDDGVQKSKAKRHGKGKDQRKRFQPLVAKPAEQAEESESAAPSAQQDPTGFRFGAMGDLAGLRKAIEAAYKEEPPTDF